MCEDRTAFIEDLCKESFDAYCAVVRATHQVALNPKACQSVAVSFADCLFEEVATPAYNTVFLFLQVLKSCDEKRGIKLEKTFDVEMNRIKNAALYIITHREVGRSMN